MVSCRPKSKGNSRPLEAANLTSSVRWTFDGHGRLLVPNMSMADSTRQQNNNHFDGPITNISPGEPKGPGRADGNCHGGSCGSGSNGGLGRDDNGDKGEFSGGSGGDGRWSSGDGSGSGDNKGQPMLIGLLKVPFQLAQAIYDKLDILSQDLGVVMGDTVGSVFGGSSRRDRSKKAARIRAEMEAERKKLEDEIAKHSETAKWLNEEIAKANEVSLKEIKEVELDHAIKEAQAHVNQLKEQVRTSGKAEPYVERGQQYNNDLNQAMIEAAKKHNEALDKHMGPMTEPLTPIPEMTEGVQPGQALPHTPEGRKIAETRNYLKFVEAEVERNPELREQKRELVKLADHSLDVASEEFGAGNFPAGDFALNLATAALDLALSMTPGIRVGKDIYEGLTGKNLLTGEKLSTFERALSFVSVATGGIAPVVIKASVGIGIMAKIAKRGVKTAEEAEEIVKSGAKAADFLDSAKNIRSQMSNLGEAIPGTTIPKYFRLKTEGTEFFVNPNATKHMGEYINSLPPTHGLPLRNDLIISSFESGVKEAVRSGAWKTSFDSGNPIISGGWELIFSKRPTDELPVIIHALMKK